MTWFEKVKNFFKNENFCFIFYCSILFVFAGILLIFYFLLRPNFIFEKANFIEELIEDLDKSPIFDLQDKYIYTPNLYENYKIIQFGKWKGTNVGCLCEKN